MPAFAVSQPFVLTIYLFRALFGLVFPLSPLLASTAGFQSRLCLALLNGISGLSKGKRSIQACLPALKVFLLSWWLVDDSFSLYLQGVMALSLLSVKYCISSVIPFLSVAKSSPKVWACLQALSK